MCLLLDKFSLVGREDTDLMVRNIMPSVRNLDFQFRSCNLGTISTKVTVRPGAVVHVYNPSTLEIESEGW
jgi:hypothetical protein